ncbi:hypothetical protein EN35_14415 [Rhodococcus qingshengii]|nr:hypothetical protein EN35_14415 [Rhodococcus qingshengii]
MSVNNFPPIDELPDWPDLEDLMCTYFARFGTTVTQRPKPDEFNQRLTGGEVFIEIARAGGGAPDEGLSISRRSSSQSLRPSAARRGR